MKTLATEKSIHGKATRPPNAVASGNSDIARTVLATETVPRRRVLLALSALSAGLWAVGGPIATTARAAEGSVDRFDFLSTNGNSNCSTAFMDSIAKMPADARLLGSCCSPMNRRRYHQQIRGLTKYSSIAEIPTNPYDIAAGLAQKLMAEYDASLTPVQRSIYRFAMENSEEKGPCCCQCWRWKVYGGLANILLRDHRFTGQQIVEVWNLSDGCGGT